MKPFWKKWWFWVLLAVVAVTLPFAILYSKTEAPAPSDEPTEVTEEPTTEPKEEPTDEPTEEATAELTEEPTAEPTEEPTEAPTEEPTAEPTDEPTEAPTEEPTDEPTEGVTYILNTSSKKFHYPDCSSVKDMKDKNKQVYTGSREELIEQGYSPCKRCNP